MQTWHSNTSRGLAHEPEVTIFWYKSPRQALTQGGRFGRTGQFVKAVALGIEDKVELVRQAEFSKNGTQVISNCGFGHKQSFGDFLPVYTARNESNDLAFTGGQGDDLGVVGIGVCRGGTGAPKP